METRIYIAAVLFLCITVGISGIYNHHTDHPDLADPVRVIPHPKHVSLSESSIILPKNLNVYTGNRDLRSLISVLDYEYKMLANGSVMRVKTPDKADLILQIDDSLDEDQYLLDIGNKVVIAGSNYQSVADGSVTMMQLLSYSDGKTQIRKGSVKDFPDSKYRGLLIDLARNWHEPSIIKQIIMLCRWYKINYLQLHLTDNESFTFPTQAFPKLPTPNRHYTKDQLRELDRFARERGVTLVPEIDVPGHAGQFVQLMPELFGIANWQKNDITINIGKEKVYKALDKILGEVADIFQTSPYIHIGADEATFTHFKEDPDVKNYLKKNNLENVRELYRHFLVRMDEIVNKHGKQTIVWEGFKREGKTHIPRDIIVMAWETLYQLPQHLIADGYTTINVSWKPLYIANERKWPPQDIYEWNIYRWENWLKEAPSYKPIQLEATEKVIGASMASWAQQQHLELPTITRRLPAMSERVWNATLTPKRTFGWLKNASDHTDSTFNKLLSPVNIKTSGLTYPDTLDGKKNQQFWFDDELTVSLEVDSTYGVRYTLDGSDVTHSSPMYSTPLTLKETSLLKAKAYTEDGKASGYTNFRKYEFRPLKAKIIGDLSTPLSELWKKKRSWEASFRDSIQIELTSGREGVIRYTTDGSHPTKQSQRYTSRVTVSETTVFTAQLYTKDGETHGQPWIQHFRKAKSTQQQDIQ